MICSLLFILLLSGTPSGAQEIPTPQEQTVNLPLFTQGLVTRYASNAIPDDALSEALNVYLDEDIPGVVVRRKGIAKYNATAITNAKSVRGIWPFDATDGTRYFVAVSSAAFYKTSGDGSWTAITGASGYSSTAEWDCTQSLGKLYCLNGATVWSWDGTSTATVTAAPAGTLIDHFRNRILISGKTGQKSRLLLSGELDATDWTLGVVSTSPANIYVGGDNDGLAIKCLMGTYQDVFLIGKADSIWGLYGFGRNDFELRELSREVGCIEDKSVQEKNGCLYWMSKRGVEKMCGNQMDRISDVIRDQIETIIEAAGNTVTVTDNLAADFNAGNLSGAGALSPMSSTISPGSIVPSTYTHSDDTNSEYILYSGTATTGGGIESSGIVWSVVWGAGNPSKSFTSPVFDTGLSSPIIKCSYYQQAEGSSNMVYYSTVSLQFSSDNVTFDSAVTCITSAAWHNQSATEITGNYSGVTKRYAKVVLAVLATGGITGQLTDVHFSTISLTASTTGYFISQCRNPSTGITSWGNFSCNEVPNGGSLTYYTSTGTTCHSVTNSTAAWTLQTNNSVMATDTALYVAYKALFDLDVATDTPTLQDCSIEWNEGTDRPPVASLVYNDRYYLAYTTSTATGASNNNIFVLDKYDKWTLLDDTNCYSMSLYKRRPYCGSSTNNGFVYLMDTGSDDSGAPYTSRIKTKSFAFGSPDARKQFKSLTLDLEPEPNTSDVITLTAQYYTDRVATAHSLGTIDLGEDPGALLRASAPFPTGNVASGRYLQLELSASGTNQPFKIFGGRLRFYFLRPD